MKKILLFTCILIMTSVTAHAACNGISIKSGKYCLSKHAMNWYSASAWCQAQGMQLIDLRTDCGSLSSCAALKLTPDEQSTIESNGGNKTARVWTHTSRSSSSANVVMLNLGGVVGHDNFRYDVLYALCK